MGPKPIIEVALKLTGNGLVPEEATALIQLAPTKTWRLGDRVQETELRRKNDGWVFALPKRETYDMNTLLQDLLNAIEPYTDKIREAARVFRLDAEISCGVDIRGETPAGWLASETISRIASLGASLDIDLILPG